MSRVTGRWFVVFGVFGVLACSLIVDTEEIDAGCPTNTKFCGGKCVGVDDATYGCTDEGCDPCLTDLDGDPFGDRFVPQCRNGACVPGDCAFGYGCDDCAARLLSDPENCGTCKYNCDGGTCSLGTCVYPDAGEAGGSDG
jgi:hypothetical protein